ncbi:hypothetical protein EXIGLDRAFT_693230 [Exidia glandulosa HHB12029]|uniref:Uncharacterized protein n=1 Tax=Exidia glandulosa HHB12029 TaxID=1314781 RepID=A0A165HG01_EXIGL|nr:hypothetical protein EXIGLDRAFT_693230 [Exidia glandulosa HHB12029]
MTPEETLRSLPDMGQQPPTAAEQARIDVEYHKIKNITGAWDRVGRLLDRLFADANAWSEKHGQPFFDGQRDELEMMRAAFGVFRDTSDAFAREYLVRMMAVLPLLVPMQRFAHQEREARMAARSDTVLKYVHRIWH